MRVLSSDNIALGGADVSTRLKEVMQRRELSYRSLGALAGMDPGHIWRIATGKHRPRRGTKLIIAKALRLRPQDLWDD
jgi:transcriptional regulator with XRE-family HTH domain